MNKLGGENKINVYDETDLNKKSGIPPIDFIFTQNPSFAKENKDLQVSIFQIEKAIIPSSKLDPSPNPEFKKPYPVFKPIKQKPSFDALKRVATIQFLELKLEELEKKKNQAIAKLNWMTQNCPHQKTQLQVLKKPNDK